MKKYIYPKLPAVVCTPLFRLAGNGLANCMCVYARGVKRARETNAAIIAPTWFNMSIGPYLRNQSDKRHYSGLFISKNEVSGINKIFHLLFHKNKIETVEGLSPYFADLLDDSQYIAQYIENHINPSLLSRVNDYDFINCVAVHVRLGDYEESRRVPISWYKKKVEELKASHPEYRFCLFSDGKDDELLELTSIPAVKRVFFGNAIADIFAISKCCYLIGSDSTFSGCGAFLGQVPCVFYRKHYGPVLKDSRMEIIENEG